MNLTTQMMDFVAAQDPEVGASIRAEYDRQQSHLELIASENIVSPAVLAAAGSVLTNKYAEGYIGKRYYGGCQCVDVAEGLAIDRAKRLFGANFANVQPHSGAQANLAAYQALVAPGETVLAMNLAHGGHLTHGSPVNLSGMLYNIVPYGVDDVSHRLDYDAIRGLAQACRPKMILAGATCYPRTIDFEKFAEIAREVGAYLMVDMAHIAGLVASGLHPNPVPCADVVTTTTHKTLRGPRGGLILCNNEEMAARIDKAVFPGQQGGPLMHIIAAKAVALGEALRPEFKDYQGRIVANAKALADGLVKRGMTLIAGGTDNHLMLVDLRNFGIQGRRFQARLDAVHITANKNAIPNDPEKPYYTSGLRLGTPAVTTRGLNVGDMDLVADLIYRTAAAYETGKAEIREAVAGICARYPLYT